MRQQKGGREEGRVSERASSEVSSRQKEERKEGTAEWIQHQQCRATSPLQAVRGPDTAVWGLGRPQSFQCRQVEPAGRRINERVQAITMAL